MAKENKDSNTDVSALPFEKALAELETIVQRLEKGDVALEESIQIYERGEVLKRRCETLLRASRKPRATRAAMPPVPSRWIASSAVTSLCLARPAGRTYIA